jgi:WD40 repeat protein
MTQQSDYGTHKLECLSCQTNAVWGVTYSPNGQQIASINDDMSVRLWNAQTGAPGLVMSGHTGNIMTVKYSPNGQQIASAGGDQTVRLWSVDSGQCLVVLSGFQGLVGCIAWNGAFLVTGCADKSVRKWQVVEEANHYRVNLCWSSGHAALSLSKASINGVQGLSRRNMLLLQQRGATCKDWEIEE